METCGIISARARHYNLSLKELLHLWGLINNKPGIYRDKPLKSGTHSLCAAYHIKLYNRIFQRTVSNFAYMTKKLFFPYYGKGWIRNDLIEVWMLMCGDRLHLGKLPLDLQQFPWTHSLIWRVKWRSSLYSCIFVQSWRNLPVVCQ